MNRFKIDALQVWIALSIVLGLFGSYVIEGLSYIGFMSLTLAIGYATRPSDMTLGRIFFAFTVLLTMAMGCKVAHLNYADFTIGVALAGLVVTFGYGWATRKL